MGLFGKIGSFFKSKVLAPVAKTVANTVLKPAMRVIGTIAEKPLALAQKAIQTVGDAKNLPVVGGLLRKGLEQVRQGKAGGFLGGVVKQLDKTDERLTKAREILDDPSKGISQIGKQAGGKVGRAVGEIFQ